MKLKENTKYLCKKKKIVNMGWCNKLIVRQKNLAFKKYLPIKTIDTEMYISIEEPLPNREIRKRYHKSHKEFVSLRICHAQNKTKHI